ncbi:hypothetical protein B296_00022439 [Ensete ventricosum]|uniref:Uncharacterized protein n=1 Tax=Ensete ventricosum TaxID=4639 RepID=A0A426Y3T6_ENSVE|nr:hypothetical protein B296_00022439 [Ensete ventricosum]
MGASGCSALLPWLKGTLGYEGAPRVAVGEEALMSFGIARPYRRCQSLAHHSSPTLISRPPLLSLSLLPIVGPTLLSSAHLSPAAPSHSLRRCLAALNRYPSFLLICHRPTLLILLLSAGQLSSEHNQHRHSFRSNRPALFLHYYRPPPLNYQQQRCYFAAPHLLGAPHDADASSLTVATATASNRAPCCYTSLLPPLHLLTATSAHCSSLGCRNNRYPSLPPPSLATTTAPPSPTSFSTYW